MSLVPERVRVARATAASKVAADKYRAERERTAALRKIVGNLKQSMRGARNRCADVKDVGYKNYGGRGIQFMFPSISIAAEWVLQNLGPRPEGKSIDRIDNNRHYEPGNMRWATRKEQNANKRAYSGAVYGRRLQRLLQQRPDYTYAGIRKFVVWGWSDEQILNHRKGSHVSSGI